MPKMARTPAEVLAFLRDLAREGASPMRERDMAELARVRARRARPGRSCGLGHGLCVGKTAPGALQLLRPGSEAVLSRGSRARRHVSRRRDDLRRAHPRVATRRSGIRRVRFFDVLDRDGGIVGQFYLDLYARPASAAAPGWTMRSIAAATARACSIRSPISPATSRRRSNGRPALFTHDEVTTLFHEFGHGLHLLLTRVDVPGVSGLEGVEWDAVELPSQFMENFCWEWDVLEHMTRARRHRRAAAARAVRQDARGEEFPERHADGAPARVRAVRHASALRLRSRAGHPAGARRDAIRREVAVVAAAAVRPQPHALASATSSPAATRPATTATNGPKCCRLTPTACSRRTGCSRRPPGRASATRCSRGAAAGRRWSRSSPFAAARPKSTPCCGIMVCLRHNGDWSEEGTMSRSSQPSPARAGRWRCCCAVGAIAAARRCSRCIATSTPTAASSIRTSRRRRMPRKRRPSGSAGNSIETSASVVCHAAGAGTFSGHALHFRLRRRLRYRARRAQQARRAAHRHRRQPERRRGQAQAADRRPRRAGAAGRRSVRDRFQRRPNGRAC